jgi:hypothetical protein
MGRNGGDVACHGQRENCVERTTVFECAAVLEIFALEDDTSVCPFVEGRRAHDGRPHQAGADEVRCGRDVCEGWDRGGVSLHGWLAMAVGDDVNIAGDHWPEYAGAKSFAR